MKLLHIPPSKLADRLIVPELTMHLVVSDVYATNPVYKQFYDARKAGGDFITLDSPAFELAGSEAQVDWDLHLEVALDLNPQEVVLPDDMLSGVRTLDWSRQYARDLRRLGYQGQFMAVPHGANVKEFLEIASMLANIPGVKTIGLQEEIPDLFGYTRMQIAVAISRFAPDVKFHYLGVDESCDDLLEARGVPIIRSCDTAKFVVWGLNEMLIEPDNVQPYPGRNSLGGRTQYFDWELCTAQQEAAVHTNIRLWKFYLEGAAHV